MDLIHAIFPCLGSRRADNDDLFARFPDEKKSMLKLYFAKKDQQVFYSAEDFLSILLPATELDANLKAKLVKHEHSVDALGWWEDVALAIWEKLALLIVEIENGGTEGASVGAALRETLAKVRGVAEVVFDFAQDHPVAIAVFCCILAIGVLWLVTPWVLTSLGFAEGGVVEESIAASWQAQYAGYVPKGSIFSYMQHLGATLTRL